MRFNRFNLLLVATAIITSTEENYTTGKRKRYYGHHYSQYQK